MAKKEKKIHCTSIGGQAIIEGVMMRGPKEIAIAVRKPDMEIVVEKRSVSSVVEKYKLRKIFILRGIVAFFESMVLGVKALMFSADFVDIEGDEDYKPSKFEAWLERKLGDKMKDYAIYSSVIFALVLSILVFFMLPNILVSFVKEPLQMSPPIATTIEGVVRILIFLGYILLVSRMKDIQRVFEYHGAEHKSIHCYESGQELTVDNVRTFKRLHPRCGTNFLLIVMTISVLFFMIVPWTDPVTKLVYRLLLLPIIAGFSFEIIKILGRFDNWFTRIIGAPGMWLQYVTTREPDDSQIEVALASLKAVLTKSKEDDKW